MNEILKRLSSIFQNSYNNNHGKNGCHFMSGATTITGNFYGFSVGASIPDSIILTTSNNKHCFINSAVLAISSDISDYVVEGEYLPIEFTSITTTGSGNLKLWNK